MEKELPSYYLVVNLNNLCYVDSNWNLTTLSNAAKFNTLEDAENFVGRIKKDTRKSYAIYKVYPQITLNFEKFGTDVEDTLNYVIKHEIFSNQSSSADPWNAKLKDCITTTTTHYGVNTKIIEEGEKND